MIALNLIAETNEENLIKDYLEQNASETLAYKINNGVEIVKDTNLLINKKDLKGFWKYAHEEARKQLQKGNNVVGIDSATVFGWAIHYFEESSIEGTLYNQDGTEYKPHVKEKPKTEQKTVVKVETPKPQNSQGSFFEMFNENKQETAKINTEPVKDEINEEIVIAPDFEDYKDELFDDDDFEINTTTGEVLPKTTKVEIDNTAVILKNMFGEKLKIEV